MERPGGSLMPTKHDDIMQITITEYVKNLTASPYISPLSPQEA
jgi:hypothetical protein